MSFIHSGSTLLNLCLTGDGYKGWRLGRISNIIGDKSSGKTLLAIEASSRFLENPPKGVTPRVIYFEGESAFDREYADSLGLDMNKVEFHSEENTVESLFDLLVSTIENSKPDEAILFVVDSLDSLTTEKEVKKSISEQDFDRKPGKVSEMFRRLVKGIESSNIHLMVISQIRQNLTAGAFGPKYTRSGGKGLDFYASIILWCIDIGKIKSNQTDMTQGFKMLTKVTKNKVATPFREVELTMIFGYGVDDIGSLLGFLSTKKYKIPDDCKIDMSTGWYTYCGNKYRYEKLIDKIQNEREAYLDIINRSSKAWQYLEEQTKPQRKPKNELMQNFV